MVTGSEQGPLGERSIDAVLERCAALGPGELLSDEDERLVFGALAEKAVATARDETQRPRARVQLLQGAAETYALLGDLAKSIELLTLAEQILPTVLVRKRRAQLIEEMNTAKHDEVAPVASRRASAPRRRRWGLPR